MTRYLVDTDWAIDFLNGRPAAVARFDQLADRGIAISVITYAELWEGITSSSHPNMEERRANLSAFVRRLNLLGIDRSTAQMIGELRGELRAHGNPISRLRCDHRGDRPDAQFDST